MNLRSSVKRLCGLVTAALIVSFALANVFVLPISIVSAANDTHWTYQTIVSANKVGSYASLRVASDDAMSVSYYNATFQQLNHASQLSSQGGSCGLNNGWNCAGGFDGSVKVGTYTSLAANVVGKYEGIAYQDFGNHTLKYANNQCTNNCNGKSWTIDTTPGVLTGQGTSLKFDATGKAHIAYYQLFPAALRYAYQVSSNGNCGDGTWQCDTIESGSAIGQYPSLDLDIFGKAHIAYYDGGTGTLKYASQVSSGGTGCNGSTVATTWSCQVVDAPSGADVGAFVALYQTKCSFGACNSPTQIAYYDSTNHMLKYAHHSGGNAACSPGAATGWQCDSIETVGQWTSPALYLTIAVRSDGTPVIAYNDRDDGPANGRLKLASPTSVVGNCGPSGGLFQTWQCDTLDTGSTFAGYRDVGQYPSVIINSAGLISIAYYDATNADLKLVSEKMAQTITFDALPNKLTTDEPFSVSATASSGLAVTFTSSGVCNVNGSLVTLSGQVGNCTIAAHQAGNATYDAAPDVAQSFAVNAPPAKQAQTISFAQLPNKITNDPPFSVSASASSGLPVSFTASGQCSVNNSTVTLSGQAGSCTVTAHQAGDANYTNAPDVARSFAVNNPAKQNQTISFAALANKTVGDAPFAVSATASSGLPVSFTASGVCSLNNTTVILSGQSGNCAITAHQAGNTTYNAAADVARSFTVDPPAKQQQTITFGALPDKIVGDLSFTVGATASSGLPVSFTAKGVCSLNGATVTLTGQAGNCTITASQAGDATYKAAADVARSFAVNDPAKQNQTISFESLSDKTLGDAPFTVNATASSGMPVSFIANGTCSVSGNLVTITGVGNCTITAWQGGDVTYNAAADVVQTFHINADGSPSTPGGGTSYTLYLPLVLH